MGKEFSCRAWAFYGLVELSGESCVELELGFFVGFWEFWREGGGDMCALTCYFVVIDRFERDADEQALKIEPDIERGAVGRRL